MREEAAPRVVATATQGEGGHERDTCRSTPRMLAVNVYLRTWTGACKVERRALSLPSVAEHSFQRNVVCFTAEIEHTVLMGGAHFLNALLIM